MLETITQFFSAFPPEIATVLMAMTPVGELRLALPVAILVFHFPIWKAVLLSVIGNAVPAMIILFFAKRFHEYIDKKSGILSRGWLKALQRAQNKFSGEYQKYGLIGLLIFIGIPLPITGAWTGALAAFVFGIPFRKAWPYVLGGIFISSILTLLVTVGADKIF